MHLGLSPTAGCAEIGAARPALLLGGGGARRVGIHTALAATTPRCDPHISTTHNPQSTGSAAWGGERARELHRWRAWAEAGRNGSDRKG